MPMEICVLSDRALASIADWQAAIDAEGFPLTLSNGVSLQGLSGFLPMQLHGRKAGCECGHIDVDDVVRIYGETTVNRRWARALLLRFGDDLVACLCAYMSGAAYARATEGYVLDCAEGRILTPREAANVVRELSKFRR
jgi:hypothetical protein